VLRFPGANLIRCLSIESLAKRTVDLHNPAFVVDKPSFLNLFMKKLARPRVLKLTPHHRIVAAAAPGRAELLRRSGSRDCVLPGAGVLQPAIGGAGGFAGS